MSGLWSRAAGVAAQTPESRNRYVDFLRALSIGAGPLGLRLWVLALPFAGAALAGVNPRSRARAR